jgi:hypothetical protein
MRMITVATENHDGQSSDAKSRFNKISEPKDIEIAESTLYHSINSRRGCIFRKF